MTATVPRLEKTGIPRPSRVRPVNGAADARADEAAWGGSGPDIVFAIEDRRHVTQRLEADLLRAGTDD